MNDHVASEGLAAYADGRLPGEARARVEAHLCRCRECREELVEVAALLAGRERSERIPDEFLRRALKADAGAEVARPVRRLLPLRPAFGIAAVFVVVVLIGTFFLGRGNKGIATQAVPTVSDRSLPAWKKNVPAPAAESAERLATPAAKGKAEAGQLGEESFADAAPAAAAIDVKRIAAPAPLPVKEERLADEAVARARLEREAGVEGGVASGSEGGVIGGVAAHVEKDKAANEARKAVAPQASPPDELQRGDTTKLRMTAQAQAKGHAQDQRRQARHGPNAENAASVATQMLLMVNSQAASPLAFAPGTMPQVLHIAGDVGRDDLLDPGPLDDWDWLGAGRSLELVIAADGTVQATVPMGDWEPAMAARAQAAARRLAFSASERPSRRAVLSAGAGPN